MGLGFTNSNTESWPMEFLLVLFPDESTTAGAGKRSNFSCMSSSLNCRNSSQILHKAQSTISICLILIFTTILLFTLSTLPSTTTTSTASHRLTTARQVYPANSNLTLPVHALQRLGTLYRRGTKAMNDVVVAHAVESLTLAELKLFLRIFHRSILASRSDLLFVFPAKSPAIDGLILRENEAFANLLSRYIEENSNGVSRSPPPQPLLNFDASHFVKRSKNERETKEPIWGKRSRIRANFSGSGEPDPNRQIYGSIVGFDAEELDPENALSGFLDHAHMSLRRWVCYPMLLGRVRRNFKHVMLVDIKETLLIGDPLARLRTQSPERVIVKVMSQPSTKNGKKTRTTQKRLVYPGAIMGGSKGIRRLANEMVMEITRASIQQRKKRNQVNELGVFNLLIANEFALRNVDLIVSDESMLEVSSLGESGLRPGSHLLMKNYGFIRRGHGNFDVNSLLMKHICSFPIDCSIYSDC